MSQAATHPGGESLELGTTPSKLTPVDGRLLEVEDLQVEFRTRDGVAKAINGVSFALDQGETLAVLGESGSGKSVTAQAIMGILDSPPGFVTGGSVRYCGHDMITMAESERRQIRGAEIAMIFQDALSSLNPVFPVGWQIAEMFRKHRGMNRVDSLDRAIKLMERVQIPAARQRVKAFPHQFSGGMRQRIMIAMALALDPAVVIADEPTTALDVTVQAQIMGLLKELQEERRMGLILITHDLGVVADVADRIAVMYAGRLVEQGGVFDLYAQPAHPYTKGLLESIPRLDQKGQELSAIGGLPPNLLRIPPGCAFSPRCVYAADVCRTDPPPPLLEVAPGRVSACHYTSALLSGELERQRHVAVADSDTTDAGSVEPEVTLVPDSAGPDAPVVSAADLVNLDTGAGSSGPSPDHDRGEQR